MSVKPKEKHWEIHINTFIKYHHLGYFCFQMNILPRQVIKIKSVRGCKTLNHKMLVKKKRSNGERLRSMVMYFAVKYFSIDFHFYEIHS